MKIFQKMKVIYFICSSLNILQLLIWIFMPFSGISGIYSMITKTGFYINSAPVYRSYTLSEKLGMSEITFHAINKTVAFIYFGLLFISVIILFVNFASTKNKYFINLFICCFTLFIWIILPLLLKF